MLVSLFLSVEPRRLLISLGILALKVAKSEHSNVLLANALHHRSDAFGSLVAVGAIGGAWLGYPVLDPLGGLLVSGMILKQGAGVGITALKELTGEQSSSPSRNLATSSSPFEYTDQVTDPSIPPRVHDLVASLRDPSLPALPPYTQDTATSLLTAPPPASSAPPASSSASTVKSDALPILAIPSIRVFASGPSILLDIQLVLPRDLTLQEANEVEKQIREKCRAEFGGQRVREVIVRLVGEGGDLE